MYRFSSVERPLPARPRLVDGIELPDAVYQQICDRAQKLGVSLSESEVTDADVVRYRE